MNAHAYAHDHDDDQPHKTCPWPDCRCTHVGCTAGWIDHTNAKGNDVTSPCPTCRPEVAQHLRTGRSLRAARASLHGIPRPSRGSSET